HIGCSPLCLSHNASYLCGLDILFQSSSHGVPLDPSNATSDVPVCWLNLQPPVI
ncbi:hypothetical protein CEXT_72111, partial [Caerostris extrusa]